MKDYLLTILTFAATVMVSAAIPFGFYSGGQRNIASESSLLSGLIAWYDFNNNTDASGNGHTLTETGSPDYATTSGAVEVDGSNYLTTPTGLFHSTPAFLADTNADGTILICYRSLSASFASYPISAAANISIRHQTSGFGLEVNAVGTSVDQTSFGALSDGVDYAAGFTYDGSTDTIEGFVNGTGYDTGSASFSANSNTMQISVGGTPTYRLYWMGVWNRVLTDAEIASITATTVTYDTLP